MNIIDKRINEKGKEECWRVMVSNTLCPYLYYPANIVACRLLEGKENDFCCFDNCKIKEI